MSEKDELARLKGGMAALKDALTISLRAARPDPTGRSTIPRDVIGIFIRNVDAKLKGRGAGHIPDALPGQAEFRAGYTNMLKEIKDSLTRR